jgi:prepilin-type N-terminal cleavage/methylation domain-containing protein
MSKQKGFTLIELLVVISIIGILSGLISIGMNGATTAAADSKKKATVDSIKKSLVIDKVETGAYPVETGCTIGTDCTNLDPVLLQYLPSDLGATYTYESDGTGCTISTILSSGDSYQYDCLASAYSTDTPVNGACGGSNGANLSSIPSSDLCAQGSSFAVSGLGPWTWTCVGANGGTNASCSTGTVPLNGACGSANGSSYYSTPSANLCLSGSASAVSGTGPWTWICNGTYSGLSPACAANISIDGVCGSSNGANVSSIPSTNLCSIGTASSVSGSGPWSWTCGGTNGGSSPACSTGGLPVNGACGLAAQSYVYTATAYAGAYCATGTQSSSPDFPAANSSATWTCNGLYSGTNSGTCTASRATAPVLVCSGSTHSEADCTAAGGTLVNTGTCNTCKFAGASCPSGWTVYASWTTLAAKTCYNGYDMNMCSWECVYPSCDPNTIVYTFNLPCSNPGHGFSNNSTTTTRCFYGHCGLWADCASTVTEIGCY